MALLEHSTTLDNLISYSTTGLEIASFTEVRNALIARYQEIYGMDIDISDDVADGVWINTLANLLESILRICKSTYEMLNINTATGTYLDNLCALTNIFRKDAYASTTTLYITNIGTSTITLNDNNTGNVSFIDSSSTEWIANVGEDGFEIEAGVTTTIDVSCEKTGKYYCPAGSITSTLLNYNYITVEQPNDAVLGADKETDDQLRLRRGIDISTSGTTVLQSLHAALYQLTGIQDVKIYNNNTLSTITANDGTSIAAHNIYIICRYIDGITINDNTVAKIIFNKLTPGISTTASAITSYQHTVDYTYTGTIVSASNTIYWCVPEAISETITISLTNTGYFAETTIDLIAEAVIETANELYIGETLTSNLLIATILDIDPLFKSRRTFNVDSVTISDMSTHDAYYQLTTYTSTYGDDSNYTTFTITIT